MAGRCRWFSIKAGDSGGESCSLEEQSNGLKEDRMTVASHVSELQKKHQALSEAVEAAQRRPGFDDMEITRMKREKMRLKEEISRLSPAQ